MPFLLQEKERPSTVGYELPLNGHVWLLKRDLLLAEGGGWGMSFNRSRVLFLLETPHEGGLQLRRKASIDNLIDDSFDQLSKIPSMVEIL